MITPADDYPLHQTAEPMAFAGTDRNFYDRFFFNGYSPQGDIFFAVALGVYPQLNLMDGAFCLSRDGVQHNFRFSKEMNGDRLDLILGGLQVEITKPLEKTRIVFSLREGISAELVATAQHAAVEEPRFTRRQGTRAFMDYTRLTQNISWSGTISVQGEVLDVGAAGIRGTRDRSWGIRPIGARDGNPLVPPAQPQFYWLWMPTNFDDFSLFFHTNDDAKGKAWNRRAVLLDYKAAAQTHFDDFAFKVENTAARRIASAELHLGGETKVSFKPSTPIFYMNGLGYTHPTWGHGMHQGVLASTYDTIDLSTAEAQLAAGALQNLHIQTASDVVLHHQGQRHQGVGVIEQMLIGAHAPSGWGEEK